MNRHLWKKSATWDKISCKEKREEGLEEIDVDDNPDAADTLICLNDMGEWYDDANFASYFLVRKEYKEFEDFINTGREKKVLLTGQPGIGALILG